MHSILYVSDKAPALAFLRGFVEWSFGAGFELLPPY